MKKMICFALLWIVGIGTVNAQWSITPEVGMALSKRNSFQTDWTGRPKIGVGLEYQLPSSPFALKSGLYYMQRGYSVDYKSGAYPYQYGYSWGNGHEQSYGGSGQPGYGTVDGGYGNYYDYPYNYGSTLKRHFLQLPVMLDYSFRLADEVRLHLAAGPYVAVSLSDHWDGYGGNYLPYPTHMTDGHSTGGYGYGSGGYGGSLPHHLNPARGLHAFDWGVSGVLGLEVKQWMFNFAYDLSLGKEYKYGSVDVKYHTVSLSVGYKFKLGK